MMLFMRLILEFKKDLIILNNIQLILNLIQSQLIIKEDLLLDQILEKLDYIIKLVVMLIVNIHLLDKKYYILIVLKMVDGY
jgi:hypothetical protein